MTTKTTVHQVLPAPDVVTLDSKSFPLHEADLMFHFSVETGYLLRAKLDTERLLLALSKTLSYFPLYCGRFRDPSTNEEGESGGWRISLDPLQPLEVEEVHLYGDAQYEIPDDRVIQTTWKWTPTLNMKGIRRGRGEEALMKMRITHFLDKGWTLLAATSSHVVGDGANMVMFWSCFSTAYSTGSLPSPPSYNRLLPLSSIPQLSSSAESKFLENLPMLTGRNPPPPPPTRIISLFLLDAQLSSLKSSVGKAINDPSLHFSLQDCLTALLAIALSTVVAPLSRPLQTQQ
ncbi:hypothetical protein BT69DRAFT_190559 [Atractiella rhizophila]|nr:hypothetical protein BT69DRAFT_190559 [Atractiella rhizophila]